MDKMKFETVDGVDRNVDKIAAVFPQVVTEIKGEDGKITRAVKWDVLKELLSGEYVEGGECYDFTWPGKRAAIAEAAKPIRKTLRPCKEESKDWDTTQNLYIEGDNLEVLKLLQESYLGKVKMIYIDPPYNTGNDSFIYKDDFVASDEELFEAESFLDEEGNINFRKNEKSNPRFHSKWCSMILQRLVLARDLLTEDGVIFISIDDNEQENLRKICDEIFGKDNFVAQLVWKSRQNKDNRNLSGVSIDHEYIFVYSKNMNIRTFVGATRDATQYSNPDNDPRGDWSSANMAGLLDESQRPNCHFDLINPETGINYGRPKMGWRYDKQTMARLIEEKRILWPENATGRPRRKVFLSEITLLPGFSSVVGDGIFTRTGSKSLDSLFHAKFFDFPKPPELIKEFIYQSATANSIVLDFFSGSATTAHAVMQLNAEDGGKRKFIMVQLPEVCTPDSEAAKAGYKNICEIGKERIRRAGEKIKEENPLTAADLDVGFRVFKLDDSNMKDVYYSADEYSQDELDGLISNIKEDRTDLDLLYGCLLEWGVELSLPHTSETIDGVTVHTVNSGDLIACFDQNIPESAIRKIAKRHPLRAVFRDSSFASAPQKINVEEIFKLLSPTTTIKVI